MHLGRISARTGSITGGLVSRSRPIKLMLGSQESAFSGAEGPSCGGPVFGGEGGHDGLALPLLEVILGAGIPGH